MKHPVEALLRAPIELWSSCVATLASLVLLFAYRSFYLPRYFAYGVALAFALLALIRGIQGISVICYQKSLLQSRSCNMLTAKIPRKRGFVYLGEGFKWTQKHAQRLADTRRPECRKYIQRESASQWRSMLEKCCPWLVTANGARSLPVSGKPELHGVELRKQNVWLNSADRVGHTLVLGTTRVGKTRLAELLLAQDIRNGHVVLVFDPKGDMDLLCRTYAEARRWGRGNQFSMFHLGYPEHSCRYNAIGRFSRITEVATRIANQLPGGGSSSAFREFAWRFVNIIAHAIVALGNTPNYLKIRKYINDIEPLFIEYTRNLLMRTQQAGWAAHVKQIEKSTSQRNLPNALKGRDPQAVALYKYVQEFAIEDPVLDGLISAFKYDRTYFDKIVSSVGPLMEKLTTGPIAELISPTEDRQDHRPMIEWLDVIRKGGIVYIGLDALSDSMVAGAVGNSMFADLVSVAGYLYKFGIRGEGQEFQEPPRVCIHADEFNELIGDEFVPLLNKAGGAGFQVTAYTQTMSDIEARVGDRAKSGQIAGNFNSLIMLRVKELATAEILTKQLPRIELRALAGTSGASDARDTHGRLSFQARNDDRLTTNEAALLSPADIVALPRGQAFALLEGGNLWKVRFPLPDKHDPFMPSDANELLNQVTHRYSQATTDG